MCCIYIHSTEYNIQNTICILLNTSHDHFCLYMAQFSFSSKMNINVGKTEPYMPNTNPDKNTNFHPSNDWVEVCIMGYYLCAKLLFSLLYRWVVCVDLFLTPAYRSCVFLYRLLAISQNLQ